ncbi:MAG: methionyl-tRNA formyltransferase [Candidatus Niyogibacteria bacterium]|nr:MAG: methionyl-tRNA formyltransferase [Candidatus Niyogibacteria bacterium]
MDFIFFGTSEFAIPILDALKNKGRLPKLVVATPDRPAGRELKLKSSPVKMWAEKNGIPVIQPENLKNPDTLQKLTDTKCRLVLVAAYGKIIPKEVLDLPEKGSLNVHPSLLPRYRGADPIRSAILAGDKKTGVTVMLMDEKMDHGPILTQKELEHLIFNAQYSILKSELAELGGKLLAETLPKWLAGEIKPKEQDHSKATYTKKITKEDGHINWSESAEIIERKIRALNPWPGTYSFWNDKRIKILEAETPKMSCLGGSIKYGEVFKKDSGVAVTCKNGAILVKKLQLEGKKSQDAKNFLNGHPDIIGAILN